MNRGLWLVVLSLGTLLLSGCVDYAPAYRESLLAYDETLLGKWRFERPADPNAKNEADQTSDVIDVEIAPREAIVTYGRLGQFPSAKEGAKNEHKTPAYLVTMRVVAQKPEEKEFERTYDAVLLEIDGTRLVAFQISTEEKAIGEYFGDVAPIHKVVRVERDGDTLRAWSMKSSIVWLPMIQPLEKESGAVKFPEKEGVYFVADPDRFVEALRLGIKKGDWEEPLVVTRVK